jgi:hypothetical protein
MLCIMSKVTLNKDGSPRKSGSGRRKGANSFANISLADLEKFCGSASVIPVSRVWLEKMGASVSGATKTSVASSTEKVEEEQKISFTLHQ